jgi:fructose-1,6-bisphosphatase/sedoheptulose 1,7-bisphosphatase-like protein
MLYAGEIIGDSEIKIDVAVDPLEGTSICANNGPDSMSVMAIAKHGTILKTPDLYMEKIAIGPGFPHNTVDLDKKTYVFEGPIDSMFVPNSIAIAGGDMISSLKGFDKKNLVVVYDNEPRSKETIKKLDKSTLNGYNVCIWPDNLDHKDVNDMVLAGMSPEFIKHIIDTNTFRDLAAKMALTKWSKA